MHGDGEIHLELRKVKSIEFLKEKNTDQFYWNINTGKIKLFLTFSEDCLETFRKSLEDWEITDNSGKLLVIEGKEAENYIKSKKEAAE